VKRKEKIKEEIEGGVGNKEEGLKNKTKGGSEEERETGIGNR